MLGMFWHMWLCSTLSCGFLNKQSFSIIINKKEEENTHNLDGLQLFLMFFFSLSIAIFLGLSPDFRDSWARLLEKNGVDYKNLLTFAISMTRKRRGTLWKSVERTIKERTFFFIDSLKAFSDLANWTCVFNFNCEYLFFSRALAG